MMTLRAPGTARFNLAAPRSSGRLTARQEFTHALERPEVVLGRGGVGEPRIGLAEYAEVRPPDDGDTGSLQQGRRQPLLHPPSGLDVEEGIERGVGGGTGTAGQAA